jgi:hypothetical protein
MLYRQFHARVAHYELLGFIAPCESPNLALALLNNIRLVAVFDDYARFRRACFALVVASVAFG